MKYYLLPLLLIASATLHAQHSLEKKWETDSVVAIPESVLPGKNILYVSLINGGAWDSDGKGGVATLSADGKVYDSMWVTGLNAPKGLGVAGNRLYAADISQVVVINIEKHSIEKKIDIEGAKGLNDITVTDKGIVYVSDSRTARIWRIENDIASLYLDSVKGVNGLKAIGNDLYIGAGKSFLKAGADKKLVTVTEVPQGIDGIEPIGNGDFLLTAWAGYVWYVRADGKTETLLETYAQKINSADIGYDSKNHLLYVPTFNAKTIACYLLK